MAADLSPVEALSFKRFTASAPEWKPENCVPVHLVVEVAWMPSGHNAADGPSRGNTKVDIAAARSRHAQGRTWFGNVYGGTQRAAKKQP